MQCFLYHSHKIREKHLPEKSGADEDCPVWTARTNEKKHHHQELHRDIVQNAHYEPL